MSGFSDETPPGLPTSQMGSMEDRVVPRVLEGPCVDFSPVLLVPVFWKMWV